MTDEHVCKLYPFQTGAEVDEVREAIIRCRDCKHYIPEEFWQEDRGYGYFETMCEPPSCKKWCVNIYDKDGEHHRYLFDVRPDGFCAWAEPRDA